MRCFMSGVDESPPTPRYPTNHVPSYPLVALCSTPEVQVACGSWAGGHRCRDADVGMHSKNNVAPPEQGLWYRYERAKQKRLPVTTLPPEPRTSLLRTTKTAGQSRSAQLAKQRAEFSTAGNRRTPCVDDTRISNILGRPSFVGSPRLRAQISRP